MGIDIVESATRESRAKMVCNTPLTAPEQSEALQCVLKSVTVHPQKFDLEIFELQEFLPGSQNRKEWLALEDDFRTLGISQIVTELPQFKSILGSMSPRTG